MLTTPNIPTRQEDYDVLSSREIYELPLTKETIPFIYHRYRPIAPRATGTIDIGGGLGARPVSQAQIHNRTAFRRLFGSWSTRFRNPTAVERVASQYPILEVSGRAHVYLRPVFFLDEASKKVAICGPFLFSPNRDAVVNQMIRNGSCLYIHNNTFANGIWEARYTVHPHLESGHGQFCLGTEYDAYQSAYSHADALSMVGIIEQLMTEYNPESPYNRFSSIFPTQIRHGSLQYQDAEFVYTEQTGWRLIDSIEEHERVTYEFSTASSDNSINLLLTDAEYKSFLRYPQEYLARISGFIQNPEDRMTTHIIQRMTDWEGNPPINPTLFDAAEQIGFQISNGMNMNDEPMTAVTRPLSQEGLTVENTNQTLIHISFPEETETDETPERSEDSGRDEDDPDAEEEEEEDDA